MAIEIVEVIGRSEQGVTQPFICRGADDALYYVKGRSAGQLSLVKEWVCGCLARELGLPIAPFEIVHVASELIDPSSTMELNDLGAGVAFGSRRREFAGDILFSQVERVPSAQRRDIMVFDRWVRNYDRSLSAKGGNPNLLWANDTESVVLIDHNNAFDDALPGQAFAAQHIFGSEFMPLCHDKAGIASYVERLDHAVQRWPETVSSLPPEWLHLDTMESVPVNFNFAEAGAVLCEHRSEGFWSW
ncbi:HipA family kinase [Aquibium sp. ELW1220]|uniref:HipA family kinase n=1 Tax=Aquibium sp. ELW1220 TaxID=2976766 RepID=UPI0025B2282D|nr:HipA family kinase [Aquibium sp. ELW1220]MDN2582160.1 hypothetical protein [Aquibium sp. ELW1220]